MDPAIDTGQKVRSAWPGQPTGPRPWPEPYRSPLLAMRGGPRRWGGRSPADHLVRRWAPAGRVPLPSLAGDRLPALLRSPPPSQPGRNRPLHPRGRPRPPGPGGHSQRRHIGIARYDRSETDPGRRKWPSSSGTTISNKGSARCSSSSSPTTHAPLASGCSKPRPCRKRRHARRVPNAGFEHRPPLPPGRGRRSHGHHANQSPRDRNRGATPPGGRAL